MHRLTLENVGYFSSVKLNAIKGEYYYGKDNYAVPAGSARLRTESE